jgi:hypothetical protein
MNERFVALSAQDRRLIHLLRLLHLVLYPMDTAACVFCRKPTGD